MKTKRIQIKKEDISPISKMPIPPVHHEGREAGTTKYPIAQLKIGESFGVKIKSKEQAVALHGTLSSTLRNLKERNIVGKRFKITMRTLDNEVRLWRIK